MKSTDFLESCLYKSNRAFYPFLFLSFIPLINTGILPRHSKQCDLHGLCVWLYSPETAFIWPRLCIKLNNWPSFNKVLMCKHFSLEPRSYQLLRPFLYSLNMILGLKQESCYLEFHIIWKLHNLWCMSWIYSVCHWY